MATKPVDSLDALRQAFGADLAFCYATGDRNPPELFATAVASDTIPLFRQILAAKGKQKRIVVAVMTNGGNLETPWPLINLLRDYSDYLDFVVLEKALSAGTLMALGADKIYMAPGTYISPIDPRRTKNENGVIVNIEVEDVIGYIDLMKERIGADSPEAAKSIIDNLTQEIKPTELGSIYRTHALIRMLSEKLLNMHRTKLASSKIKIVVENLTEQLFSHNHLISRNEAKTDIGFGDVIQFPKPEQEQVIQNLVNEIRTIMKLDEPFNPKELLGTESQVVSSLTRALVWGSDIQYEFITDYILTINPQDNNQPILSLQEKGWQKKKGGK